MLAGIAGMMMFGSLLTGCGFAAGITGIASAVSQDTQKTMVAAPVKAEAQKATVAPIEKNMESPILTYSKKVGNKVMQVTIKMEGVHGGLLYSAAILLREKGYTDAKWSDPYDYGASLTIRDQGVSYFASQHGSVLLPLSLEDNGGVAKVLEDIESTVQGDQLLKIEKDSSFIEDLHKAGDNAIIARYKVSLSADSNARLVTFDVAGLAGLQKASFRTFLNRDQQFTPSSGFIAVPGQVATIEVRTDIPLGPVNLSGQVVLRDMKVGDFTVPNLGLYTGLNMKG